MLHFHPMPWRTVATAEEHGDAPVARTLIQSYPQSTNAGAGKPKSPKFSGILLHIAVANPVVRGESRLGPALTRAISSAMLAPVHHAQLWAQFKPAFAEKNQHKEGVWIPITRMVGVASKFAVTICLVVNIPVRSYAILVCVVTVSLRKSSAVTAEDNLGL